jgi:hypothetical protein
MERLAGHAKQFHERDGVFQRVDPIAPPGNQIHPINSPAATIIAMTTEPTANSISGSLNHCALDCAQE